MKADNVSVPKITVVVRHGIVKSIFINKRFDTAEVEIVDLDTTRSSIEGKYCGQRKPKRS